MVQSDFPVVKQAFEGPCRPFPSAPPGTVLLTYLKNLGVRLKTSEHSFMMAAAAVIGLLGGLGAILFRRMISLVNHLAFGTDDCTTAFLQSLSWWHILLVPAIGGLVIGPIVYYFARETKGHGVPEVIEAVALKHGIIRRRIVASKILASAISIGTGGSVGREGPIVQIGSAIGSTLGQILGASRSKIRTMVGCGAAAGIAATFNAPVAGVLFSLEIILGDFGVRRFTPIVVSSVIATAVSHHFLGNAPAFAIPVAYEMVSPFELLSYSVLGIAAALVALLFIWMIYRAEDLFEALRIPPVLKAALGGLLIGLIGLKIPHVFGVGYETIEEALNENFHWTFLLLLIGAKLLATSLTLGSGGSGGIFAPSLLIGAVLGGGMGHAFHGLFPNLTATHGAYSLVGMGAVVSAATHAPLTSIMIIFEMTGDYRIILPLMFACIIGNTLATRLKSSSIYTEKLARRGLNISRGQDVNVMASLTVRDVLSSNFLAVAEDTKLGSMLNLMMKHPHAYFYVRDSRGRFKGIVDVEDLRQVILDGAVLKDLVIARDIMNDEVPRVHVADRLDKVMLLFGSTRREEMPVVDEATGRLLVGVVTHHGVISAYNREILKRDAIGEVLVGVGSAAETGPVMLSKNTAIAEIEAPGWMAGKTLAALNLRRTKGVQVLMVNPAPDGAGGETTPDEGLEALRLVPGPDYRIRLGDNLVLLGPPAGIRALKKGPFVKPGPGPVRD